MRKRRRWLRWLYFAFVRPGMMRRVMIGYLAFYAPGFHPWQVDDRALAQATGAELQLGYLPA